MGKNFTSVFAVCLAISAIPLACGGDDDDDGGDGKGGKGGSSGSAGSTSTGGKAGSGGSTSTGGKAGSGGSTSTGGKAGSGGTAGTVGGEGGMGGAEGGMGGEGGMTEPPATPCEQMCASTAGLDCANEATCVTDYCMPFYDASSSLPACEALLDTFFLCWTALPASASECDTKLGYPVSTSECSAESDAAFNGGCFG